MAHHSFCSPTFRRFIGMLVAVCLSSFTVAAEPEQSPDHIIIDGVKIPLDKTIEVVGPCLTTDTFRLGLTHAQAALLGLRVEGRANQENISFHLLPQTESDYEKVRSLKQDAYYKIRGRISGARLSGPKRICNFIVEQIESIPAAPLIPADFVGRIANFDVTTAANGTVQVHGETLRLAGLTAWPENIRNKTVNVRGLVMRDQQGYQLTMPTWKLVELADMVGQEVSLDGTIRRLNDQWWFAYRDEKLYLISHQGPQLMLSGDHGRSATVTGRLVRQLRPSLDQLSEGSGRDFAQTYVIRGAELKYRDAPMGWSERFGTVYTQNKVSDDVPELLAESSLRRNLLGNETDALLYGERNVKAVNRILSDMSPKVRNVLVRRMNDTQVDRTLRLLYAAILSRVNDERGREFLLKSTQSPGEVPINEIYYCLGIFPFLDLSGNDEIKTDCAWAEKLLVSIMSTPDTAYQAAQYSSIPFVLIRINSPAAQKVLLEFALRTEDESRNSFFTGPSVTSLLCHPSVQLPSKDLLRLEAVTKQSGARRTILRALLRMKKPEAVERFLNELKNGFVYMDFRDQSSPEVLAALETHLPRLTGEARSNAEMLLVLGEQDPVPTLLSLLNDPKFSDKTLLMFELRRLADPRAVSPVARVLRQAPRNYFGNESELNVTGGIEHALESVASTHSRNAVRELIELIDVDLSRFGGYIDRSGLQRIVATHLIEITGESFGVDQTGWREWEKAQADERFHPVQPTRSKRGLFRTGPDQSIDLGQ